MADIKIRVSTAQAGEIAQAGQPAVTPSVPTEKLAVASIFAQQAVSLGKQVVSASINNIGNFTGDYVKQDQVQNIVDNVSTLASIGLSFAVSPVAGLVATAGFVTKSIINVVSENRQELKRERSVELLRERSGNSTTNGSRTEN